MEVDLLMFDEPVAGPIPDEMRQQVDVMTYEDMVRKVRTAQLNDPLFRGETGRYFHAAMKQKRHALADDERAAIHHKVGF